MHQQFVWTATANNATNQYDKVEYGSSTGVEGFYYALDKMASCMVEWPSDYSFCLPGYMIRCSNVISSPNFVLWRIFVRMPGRLRRLVSVHGTHLKVPLPRAIILDPAHIKPQPRGIIIFLVVHLPPRPGIIPLVQIRKGSPPLEIMEIIMPR